MKNTSRMKWGILTAATLFSTVSCQQKFDDEVGNDAQYQLNNYCHDRQEQIRKRMLANDPDYDWVTNRGKIVDQAKLEIEMEYPELAEQARRGREKRVNEYLKEQQTRPSYVPNTPPTSGCGH